MGAVAVTDERAGAAAAALVDELLRWQPDETAGRESREALAVRRLLSKRLRKSPLEPGVADRVRRAVATASARGRPLRLLIPFGGYKSPRSPEHPRAAWAELFSVLAMCELAVRVAALLEPGVVVEYRSDARIVPRLTGLGEPALGEYRRGFDRILGFVGARRPANVALRQTFSGDEDPDELVDRVRALGERLESSWYERLSADERRALLARSARNRVEAVPSPATLRRAACEHEAYLSLFPRWYADDLDDACTIPIAMRRGLDGWLHLGSNRRSDVQFWAGLGIVDATGARLVDRIVSPRQAAAVRPELVDVRIEAVALPGFETLPVRRT